MICRGCGRPIKSKESIKRGYGPVCYRKAQRELEKIRLSKMEEQLEGQMNLGGDIYEKAHNPSTRGN